MGTPVTLDLSSSQFRDKISGCWVGKNCGGTLGAPLEQVLGQPEPLDVWWYPELREGGIPNDDLEIQLVWLKALEEVGPHLKAADLAQYWLDYIKYNFDEYGFHKTNLRLGLLPPVSGAYNNWFRDCMGSPIRSEIWACVAPGVPALAARYAYEDALCDHAGGEGVFAEIFNAVVESAAFVLSDRDRLLDIGLSYIPDECKTALAIRTARMAYAEGCTWLEARQCVLEATPHHVAQYAPINLGFQVIGWLYGTDFADALCKTVNCGYDTDCTGATLGSVLGIIAGEAALPAQWTQPLGEHIATNESWGGLAHLSSGPNPVPTRLSELTERVCVMAKKVLETHEYLSDDGLLHVDPESLYAPTEFHALYAASPWTIEHTTGLLDIQVTYPESPVGLPGTTLMLRTTITNPHPEELHLHCAITAPVDWKLAIPSQVMDLPARDTKVLTWNIPIPAASVLCNTNQLLLSVHAEGRPALPALPLVIIGARRYRVSGPYTLNGVSDAALLDHAFAPEVLEGELFQPDSRVGDWEERAAQDNALPFADLLESGGALYIQTFLYVEAARDVWMGVMASSLRKLWVNGQLVVRVDTYRPFRPSPLSEASEGFAHVHLQQGWNELLVKCVRSADAPAFIAHLLMSTDDRLHHALPDILYTRLSYDAAEE